MERANSLGVRKGAWTKEEDALLKNCVEEYGEGKWHLVPLRTGLNRCRKSCRLRWLNYLRPNITRGSFTRDEIDLLIRLHKLLGNRWSLIAGRIPGRTANDVKNFWNTRIEKKSGGKGQSIQKTITKTNIVRPKPRFLSNLTIQDGPVTRLVADHDHKPNNPINNDEKLQPSASTDASLPSSSQETDQCVSWWSNLLDATEDNLEIDISFLDDKGKDACLWTGPINPTGLMDERDDSMPHNKSAGDFDFDDDIWELLGHDLYTGMEYDRNGI